VLHSAMKVLPLCPESMLAFNSFSENDLVLRVSMSIVMHIS